MDRFSPIPDFNDYLREQLSNNQLFKELESKLDIREFFDEEIGYTQKGVVFQKLKDYFQEKRETRPKCKLLLALLGFSLVALQLSVYSS